MQRFRWWLIPITLAAVSVTPAGQGGRAAQAAGSPDPRPVPRVPLTGPAVSTVDDFAGFVGTLSSQGTGVDGHGNPLEWDADLSFMQGTYLGRDGVPRTGTFCFI